MSQLKTLEVELHVRRLAKSWGVELPDPLTMTLATLALLEHIYKKQESVMQRIQEVHAEQTKMWIQLRSREKRNGR